MAVIGLSVEMTVAVLRTAVAYLIRQLCIISVGQT